MSYADVMEDDVAGGEAHRHVPTEMKGLRACIVCMLVKTTDQVGSSESASGSAMDYIQLVCEDARCLT